MDMLSCIRDRAGLCVLPWFLCVQCEHAFQTRQPKADSLMLALSSCRAISSAEKSSILGTTKSGLCLLLFPSEPEQEDCCQDEDIQADMNGSLHLDGCNVYGCS